MTILKNGLIYDGSGNPPFYGNVTIEEDTIRSVTKAGSGRGEAGGPQTDEGSPKPPRIIDCNGLAISPGFIDAHSHNDFFAAREENLPYFDPFIRQGVTTMITGNCGFSAAGYLPGTPHNELIGGGLFSNQGRDFGSFSSWAGEVESALPVNMLSLVGHGTVRISLNSMNERRLDEGQLREMERILERDLDEGAAGISFGLMYEPGRYAPRSEIELAARIAERHDKIVSYHARALSKVSTTYFPPIGGRPHGLRAIDEVIDIAERTGVRTQFSHLIFVGEKSWGYVDEALALLEAANRRGIDIGFDMYSVDFGASIIIVVLPSWYLTLPEDKKGSRWTRLRLFLEMAVTRRALGFDFDDMRLLNTHGRKPEIEGKTIGELARERNTSELQAYLDAVDETDALAEVLMFKYANEEIIDKLRVHPLAIYMSDAWRTGNGPQNYALYYNFPKFLVLARDRGTPTEEAVHKMTGAPADRYRMADRGYISEGRKADITVFDPKRLAYRELTEEYPAGIEHVFINGREVLVHGELKDPAGAGQFIRDLRSSAPPSS